MAGKGLGSKIFGILALGLIVVVLLIVADIATAILIIPLLIATVFGAMSPEMMLIITFVISIIMAGVVFTLAGFRRK